jgi:L,D-peptidoglycan transpeptidase YkuD (ErfK/YbiS/YcfS/YnhG family)
VGNPVIGKGEAGHSLPYTTTLPSSGWVSWHTHRRKTKTSLCAIVITFRTRYITDSYYFLCCSGTNDSFVPVANVDASFEHVQTWLSTRDCLTQHPSDTLRLFRELNCRTSYSKVMIIF